MTGESIICIASSYFYDPTSKHHVMNELSKSNHVLWINWHASRRPSLSGRDLSAIGQKLRQIRGGVIKVHDRLWVMTPLVLPLPNSWLAQQINRLLVGLQTRWVLRTFPGRRQVWSFAPDIGSLRGVFGESVHVYYCVDEFSAFPGYDPETIRRLDREMCENADLVVTTSRALYEGKRPHNPSTIEVPHGVAFEHFAQTLRPDFPEADDLRDIPRPRVGFYGLIREWWDLDLIADLAKRRPDWSFVLVGDKQTETDVCSGLPNVHLLGQKRFQDLPHYSKGFDAAIVPHRLNELTRNMNPIKLREYLAAGLPVVSRPCPLPELDTYGTDVRIADTADEWIAALEQAMADRNPAADLRRSRLVANDSWAARTETIVRELERVLPGDEQAQVSAEARPVGTFNPA